MLERARQLSLREAPVNHHLAEQMEYVQQMQLPEDDDDFLHEVKKASIRTLEERHLREYELRHAAMRSASYPSSRSATVRAGPSRRAQTSQASTTLPQTGDYPPSQQRSQPRPSQHRSHRSGTESPTYEVAGVRQPPEYSQAASASTRGSDEISVRVPSPSPSIAVTVTSAQRQQDEEERWRQRRYEAHPLRPKSPLRESDYEGH